MWKWEEGFEEGETPTGPAWIDQVENGEPIHSEEVAGGEWIARDEAIRVAQKGGHDLILDE